MLAHFAEVRRRKTESKGVWGIGNTQLPQLNGSGINQIVPIWFSSSRLGIVQTSLTLLSLAASVRTSFSSHSTLQKKDTREKSSDLSLVSLVAGVGLEPHDLRVMSPTSCQLLHPAMYLDLPKRNLLVSECKGNANFYICKTFLKKITKKVVFVLLTNCLPHTRT